MTTMAVESAQALEALARATESLAGSIVGLKSPWYVSLPGPILGGVLASLIGFLVSEFAARRREKRRREHERCQEQEQQDRERRLLAGALAAELQGVADRWDSIRSARDAMEPRARDYVLRSAAGSLDQSYFSFFEGAGSRLLFLPDDLARDVVKCYVEMKAILDRLSGAMGTLLAAASAANSSLRIDFEHAATTAETAAVKEGEQVFANARALAGRLEVVAAGHT